MRSAAFIYDDVLTRHDLGTAHPLKSVRLKHTYDLLDAYGAFDLSTSRLVKPRMATEEEILTFHTPEYLTAVQKLCRGEAVPDQGTYNLGTDDNPAYEGMYEAACWSTGASLRAAELVASDEADVAFSISGGLHHAMPDHASGFCVFNDPAIAINHLLSRGMRVAYVDIDCHHGDGVQNAFYDTDDVLTISVHESASFLFPGTGLTQETGTGKGTGYSVNVPLFPFTTDDTFLWAFRETVSPLVEAYRPDVLVTQLGIDTHFKDPITHLALTVQGFGQVVSEFPRLATKWLALGGGGYDIQAVARGWTVAYGIMSEQKLPDEVPASYRKLHGVTTLADPEGLLVSDSVQKDARAFAENSVRAVQRLVFPSHGLTP